MIFHGNIKSGKLEIYNREQMKDWLATRKDGSAVLEVRQPKKGRSFNQNNYYWGVVIKTLADELGYFPDEMHDALKYKFLAIEEKEGLIFAKSSADLESAAFEHYLMQIRVWAARDLNITIPLPE
jgi:hypothetical protein|tara:strand:- start:2907 stop:3281 length:375 start_codon:yes stop_codon:yes gene_type:complete